MLILSFLLVSLLVGGLLYLPFFLWFRRQRRRGVGVPGEQVRFTMRGVVWAVVQLLVCLISLQAAQRLPDSWLGRLVSGPDGPFRCALMVMIASNLVVMVARRAGLLTREAPPAAQVDPPGAMATVSPRSESRRALQIHVKSGPVITFHLSFLLTGVALSVIVSSGGLETIGCWVASIAIYTLHEIGHAVAARRRGLKVFAIELSMLGGLCRTQLTRGVADTGWVFAAGLLTQLGLLALVLLVAAVVGPPESTFGHGLFLGFTVINGVIMVINLIPGQTQQGLKTDGAVLWELWRHVRTGAPHPLAAGHAASPLFSRETRLTEIDGMLPAGFSAGVEMLNDDTTPMEFVADMLTRYFGLDAEAALAAMLEIHTRGGKLFPTADLPQARTLASAIALEVRAAGHVLVCRAVEATPARGSWYAEAGEPCGGAAVAQRSHPDLP